MTTVVLKSKNRKVGPIAATYAALHACPTDCTLSSVCYGKRVIFGGTAL